MNQQTVPEHEKIFNEICNKLHTLSQEEESKNAKDRVMQLDKMQNQLKSFQFELMSNHEDMKVKIESLEKMSSANSDLSQKVKELTELLNHERIHNTKLSTDLARSLDLSLKFQLEIQEVKTKAVQAQMDERRLTLENFEKMQLEYSKEKSALLNTNDELLADIKEKEDQIEVLNQKINELEKGMGEIELTSQEQAETIRHLMNVAENKIVELKLNNDQLAAELENLNGQHKQVITQIEILRQENFALKDYINKMTTFQQKMLTAQAQS